ncbi:hypothetical protein [Bibersteinia trehalosi]|uniref:hypothetical protein n=1 Tax=Bibersteinia trehalosi TaxID=47735 RepID=UPI00118201EB|nr:hypothetical protein [Bibersteinia trehalosi]
MEWKIKYFPAPVRDGRYRGNDFPKPVYGVASGSALYSWKEVANWLYQRNKISKMQWEVAEFGAVN